MAANTATPTRADRARKYVELSGLEAVLINVVQALNGVTDERVVALVSDNLQLSDLEHNSGDLFSEFFPNDDEENSVEQVVMEVESSAFAASIFALMASEEMQGFYSQEAARLAANGAMHAARVREMLAGDGVDV